MTLLTHIDSSTHPYIWATKNDGLLLKHDTKMYDNELFVDTIRDDTGPMSLIVGADYPSPMNIHVDTIPTAWQRWDNRDIKRIRPIDRDKWLEEIPAHDRLWTSRGELFSRARTLISLSGLSLKGRTIRSDGVPVSQNEALLSLLIVLYALVEKNTTASLKRRGSVTLSTDRRNKFYGVIDILKNGDMLDITLLSYNNTLSTYAIKTFYYLSTIYGSEQTNTFINNKYRNLFCEQIREIHLMEDIIN